METPSIAVRCYMEIFTLRRAPLCEERATLIKCAVLRNLDPRLAQSSSSGRRSAPYAERYCVEACTQRRAVRCGKHSPLSKAAGPTRRELGFRNLSLQSVRAISTNRPLRFANYFRAALCGFRKRTPSPALSSSMNSIPAASSACRMAASFAAVTGISPSITSTRRIVATPTFDSRAKSSALRRSIARAARI
jgi:hypothetical protein